MPEDFVQTVYEAKDIGVAFVVTNYLFHFPLHGYYVFDVDLFEDGDIEGQLMSVPLTITGPFKTFDDAASNVQQTLDSARAA